MSTGDKRFSSCAQILMLILICRSSGESDDGGGFLFCANSSKSSSSSASVHSIRPAQVTVISAVVLSEKSRSDENRVLDRLSEIFAIFNPDVSTAFYDQRGFIGETKNVKELLIKTQWELLLLFIPADEIVACTRKDFKVAVDETVIKLDAKLNDLYKTMTNTLVHVVVWSGLSGDCDGRVCGYQCEDGYSQSRHRLDTVVFMASLQESVSALLARRNWFSDREDFSVMLQSGPVHREQSASRKSSTSDLSIETSKLTVQLWANLLQPIQRKEEEDGRNEVNVLCPSEEKPYLRTHRNSPSPVYGILRKAEHSPRLDPVMGSNLTCDDRTPSPTIPTSVHALRPADIKVVAALGDSLTAANGVGASQNNLLGVLTEYRGLSWSIGGDQDLTTVTTLPNILKEFNPSIKGFSLGKGSASSSQGFLNQAVAGANADDLVKQTRALITRMKEDPRIDFLNDWKVITVFIGGNDMCDHCSDTRYFSPDNIVKYISEALDILHNEVPRALVNLVELLELLPLRRLHQDTSIGCPTWLVNIICRCVLKPKEDSDELQRLQKLNKDYQVGMKKLVETGRYDTHDNFSVILQPFLRNVFLPVLENGKPDRSYFGPDCFHLSQKAHTLMARALWNNMLEPLGNKTDNEDFTGGIALKCPDKSAPYLRTYRNSNYTYESPPPTPPPTTNWGRDFSCADAAPSDSVPASVHRLRPGDVNVVASLGDSLTAGLGAKAKSLLQLINEERGVAWSIGGDKTLETITTLPNIIKKFNPKVFGFSKGRSKRPNGFNMAVSGAKASGIPGQVRDLVTDLKNSTNVNFERDWKLVTLFIGGNDLCQYCYDRDSLSPTNYINHIKESLDLLYNEVPRVLVNFVEILEIKDLRMIKRDTLGCSLVQKNLCPCFLGSRENSPELSEMKKVNRDLQTETERLVYGGRYDGREDFAVVIQPFFQNSIIPMVEDGTPDVSYFSVDCFHFSERGHSEMALALWNNMMEPVGEKQTYNNFTYDRSKIRCPTEKHPFIFTRVNSGGVVTTTPAPTALPPGPSVSPLPKECPNDAVPAWAATILAVGGLLIGCGVSWCIFYYRKRSSKKRHLNSPDIDLSNTKL